MLTILSKLFKEMVGGFWWQIPVAGGFVVTLLLWDNARVGRKVDAGKWKSAQRSRSKTARQSLWVRRYGSSPQHQKPPAFVIPTQWTKP